VYNEHHGIVEREPIDSLTIVDSNMFLADYKNDKLKSDIWYAEVEGYLTADDDGEFEFGVSVYGTAKLYVDNNLVVDNETKQTQGETFFGSGSIEERGVVFLKKGQKYHIKVEFGSGATSKLHPDGVIVFGGGLRLGGCQKIDAEKAIALAYSLAKKADQVIICAGLNVSNLPLYPQTNVNVLQADWEGEGADRTNMDLPGHMNTLISTVAQANPNTVVVMQSGTPVSMPWIEEVPALIQAWYGGNETGNAIADVLFGDVNPSGKLPLSFPKRVQDNPAYLNYRSQHGRTLYGEDVYIGYRYYEAVDRQVLFPFGHGLSYTQFTFSNLRVKKDAKEVSVTVNVKNTGKIAGAEVVQVYVAQQNPSIARPPKELKGFAKVFLEPGASKDVVVTMETKYATSYWDEGQNKWIMEKDAYEVIVSDSSAISEKSLTGKFDLEETSWWLGL
jgi:beta-glucosidase